MSFQYTGENDEINVYHIHRKSSLNSLNFALLVLSFKNLKLIVKHIITLREYGMHLCPVLTSWCILSMKPTIIGTVCPGNRKAIFILAMLDTRLETRCSSLSKGKARSTLRVAISPSHPMIQGLRAFPAIVSPTIEFSTMGV